MNFLKARHTWILVRGFYVRVLRFLQVPRFIGETRVAAQGSGLRFPTKLHACPPQVSPPPRAPK